MNYQRILLAFAFAAALITPSFGDAAHPAVDRARYFPMAGHEQDMVGGKFEGSNVSEWTGYEPLGEITTAPPAGQWSELPFTNPKPYRWVRYAAPPGSYGHVAEIEFYVGKQKVGFGTFGSLGHKDTAAAYMVAADGKTTTAFDSSVADGQYVGTDVSFWVCPPATLDPAPSEQSGPVQVTLKGGSPEGVIHYSFEGFPGPDSATYTAPIPITKRTTIFTSIYRDGVAPSFMKSGTYFVGEPPKEGLTTLHIGNSLTGSAGQFPRYLLTAGIKHEYHAFMLGGSATEGIWQKYVEHPDDINNDKTSWNQTLSSLTKLDDLTLQVQNTIIDPETQYDLKFLDVFREKFPQMQPWLYAVWPETYKPAREIVLGKETSFEMKMVTAPLTYEEGCAADLLYVEDVRTKINQTYAGDKKPLILPNAIAAGCLRNLIDQGKLPGITTAEFPFLLYKDNYHPGPMGRYLLDMVWYAAFYHDSPVGKVLPIEETEVTPEQAAVLQKLAWNVTENYPDCGLYKEGTDPVGAPQVANATGSYKNDTPVESSIWTNPNPETATPVTLSSSTPGAWFRYTLDGTTPTRTCGYIYCGVISVRPGTTLKVIGYKSGMKDSTVMSVDYPAK